MAKSGATADELAARGLLSEREFVECYLGSRRVRPSLTRAELSFAVAFSLFKMAGILQGVYKRHLDGNASDRHATRVANPRIVALLADSALALLVDAPSKL